MVQKKLREVLVLVLFPALLMSLPTLVKPLPIDLQGEPEFAPGQVLIQLKESASLQSLNKINRELNAEVSLISKNLNIYLVKFPLVVDKEEALTAYRNKNYELLVKYLNIERERVNKAILLYENSGFVHFAEPNRIAKILYTPNDPYFRDATGFPNQDPDQYGMFNINAQAGWDISQGGDAGRIIAIIDTGTDLDHPDLGNNIWVNPGETPNNGVDDDGNGYIDDVNGFDFSGNNAGDPWNDDSTSQDNNPDVFAGDPSVGDGIDNNLDGMADAGVSHGTHCAGDAASVMDNSTAFAGIAGHVKIMSVRALSPEGTGFISDLIQAIDYVTATGADVISMSWGLSGGSSQGIESALQAAYNNGIILVAASGNSGSSGLLFPSSLSFVMAVGSFNDTDDRSSFSTYGSGLDVVAPGGEYTGTGGPRDEWIWSTYVFSVYDENQGNGNAGDPGLAGMVGTSMACPHAAGLAGLVRSMNPSLSPDSVYQLIRNGARDLPPNGYDQETGYGAIDVYNTLAPFLKIAEFPKFARDAPNLKILKQDKGYSVILFIPNPDWVSLNVYNAIGRKVKALYQGNLKSGTYSFYLHEWTPGVYFVTLNSPYIQKKLFYVK